ncbi:DNA alkylation repair protein [Anaeroselena agilis]|uniref:DNA alkylation repair protein n=1 Tax=Anaeroselena agilis TaxID=3063788 RepID=A0ABU3NXM8_9FIRM|nr:DNA alkylation repair protein [Selenomonadales bacterium 4137-cl]
MTEELIAAFYAQRNPAKAGFMAAYMKDKFPFLGISKPERAALQRDFLRGARQAAAVDWGLVARLWALPEREFQYLACDYLAAVKGRVAADDIGRLAGLVTAKSWWDTVDALAAVIVGDLCARRPELVGSYVVGWSTGENLWLARTAILFQLKYKEKTDTEVLGLVIRNTCGTKEFFLNKAIGWALREYSKTDREWVRAFVAGHKLHPLSVREGSKYLT